ncbi:unnamed protein product [Rotaria sp. Silwood2]|nr:unnamed protein product [Rotaria sp. Silwood2]CAF3944309.1 unnamed protein product [Rotaria sp. Silwood2]
MLKMAGQQRQYSSRYQNLLITVKHDTEARSITDTHSNPRTRRSKDNYRSSSFQPKNIYYNSNHRHQQQQYFTRPSHASSNCQQQQYYNSYDRIHYRYQHQPIRPLMEIKNDLFSSHHDLNDDDGDNDMTYHTFKQREPKQRGQYRNRKAELDWDHAFDLDLIDLYTTHIDIDSHSLTSTVSSSDHSFTSV